mmetsp:Transcript_35066/g.109152  ORF Transcript_35066/g.109152 Transcript_35066/m.109152 type:complete len:246 (-) Transcript_35066:54-791(-)
MFAVASSVARRSARASPVAAALPRVARSRPTQVLARKAIRAAAGMHFQSSHSTRAQVADLVQGGLKNRVTEVLQAVIATVWEGTGSSAASKAIKLEALNGGSLAEVLVALEDPDAEVRRGAVDILAQRAPWSAAELDLQASILSALAECCEDSAWQVRQSTMRAIRGKAVAGDRFAVAAVVGCLQDGRPEVRVAALDTVSLIARCGAARTASAVAACLENDNSGLRWRSDEHSAAATALAERLGA